MNPPFKSARGFIEHYLDEKKADPSTSLVLVLPLDPGAKWWHLTKSFEVVASYPAGSQLFTLPNRGGGGRKRLRPCHFPVVVIRDPPVRPGPSSVDHVSHAIVAAAAHKQSASASQRVTLVLDSGASHHMCPELAALTDVVDIGECPACMPRNVCIGNGMLLPVTAVGNLRCHDCCRHSYTSFDII